MRGIEMKNVSKTYVTVGRRHTVFKNFNLKIDPGSNLGVIGPNGAGKSTLMKLLAGGLQPDTGHITRNMSVSWPLGYSGGISTSLTGVANCRFLARLYGKDPDEITRFAGEFSELKEFMDWPVKTYSSGMRSRLAFALSMAIDFDCLLIDEGMSAGDQFFRTKAQDALEERRLRSSLILASHNLREVIRLCDRLLVLGGPEPEFYEGDIEARVNQYAVEMSGRRDGLDF
jgi:capsular polysaccharide transport system ATP-binding protein